MVWRLCPTPVRRNLPSLKPSALVVSNRLNQPLPSHQNQLKIVSNNFEICHLTKISPKTSQISSKSAIVSNYSKISHLTKISSKSSQISLKAAISPNQQSSQTIPKSTISPRSAQNRLKLVQNQPPYQNNVIPCLHLKPLSHTITDSPSAAATSLKSASPESIPP